MPGAPALLLLSDGYVARGTVIGRPGTTVGKLVFNTSMTGYQEVLTDPSYAGEILVFTFPLIGIYGAAEEDRQSGRIHARGLVVGELASGADNWRADRTLQDLLLLEGATGIAGVDTRRLTRHLRDRGEMYGVITSELSEAEARKLLAAQPDFGSLDLVAEVTCSAPYVRRAGELYRQDWTSQQGQPEQTPAHLFAPGAAEPPPPQRPWVVAAYDFGIKRAILDCLAARNCEVHVFPATASAADVLAVNPDGVFLSNGPGDPARMDYVQPHLRELIGRVPIFGICLGHQLLARVAGLPTYRLKFGNRGANHPVLELDSGRVHISSQNHSYAVALGEGADGRPAGAESYELTGANAEVAQLSVAVAAGADLASAAGAGGDKPPPYASPQSAPPANRRPLGPDRPRAPYPHPLNEDVLVTHLNVNDSSNEGLAWRNEPVFSVQYHPEGSPGPRDNTYLFERFCALMAQHQHCKD